MPPTTTKATAATKKAAAKATATAADDPGDDTADDTTPTGPATVDDLVDEYLETAQAALKSYADLARRAGKRLAGETKDAGSWADDTASFWGLVARDQISAMKLWNDVMAVSTRPIGKRP